MVSSHQHDRVENLIRRHDGAGAISNINVDSLPSLDMILETRKPILASTPRMKTVNLLDEGIGRQLSITLGLMPN